jgi:hypothetical protein
VGLSDAGGEMAGLEIDLGGGRSAVSDAAGAGGAASAAGVSVENIITVLDGDRAVGFGKAVKTLPHLVH